MVKRDWLTGWTPAEWSEFRMWCTLTSIVGFFIIAFRVVGFVDWFRLIFFASPAWLTVIFAPCMKDRHPCKLLMYSGAVFMGCWLCVHAYPSQCRHAWGTMMITNTTFMKSDDIEAQALLREKDTFFLVSAITPRERQLFWPNNRSIPSSGDPRADAQADMTQVLAILKGEHPNSDGATPSDVFSKSAKVKKWVDSWSGGEKLDSLLLRAYCTMHQMDTSVPHVYPLRVLGVLPNQANIMLPCPYWSCLLTEARPTGKLPFFTAIVFCAVLNWMHWRFDCMMCDTLRWWLGAGSPRVFWSWFWAALLPLCLVMGIKTTYDEELAVVISQRWHSFLDPIWNYAFTVDAETGNAEANNSHIIQLAVLAALLLLTYAYRQRIRRELGLDENTWLNFCMPRSEIFDEHMHTFQVCVWRVDISGEVPAAPSSPSPRSLEDGEGEDPERTSMPDARSLMIWGSPGSRHNRSWMSKLYTPMFKRAENPNVLTTADGRVPTLSVHFLYGHEEVKCTRAIRPTQDAWWNHDPIYFQEVFKVSVEWRPNAQLRCEIRDASASLGQISLGSVTFNEGCLEREFHRSRQASSELARRHSVPVVQYVQMSAVPPTSQGQEDQQISELKRLGFEQHRLTDGGAVWLAFHEHVEELNEAPLCC